VHAWLLRMWRTDAQASQGYGDHKASDQLSDFTMTQRVLILSSMALLIGVFSAFVALALLSLIGLFTHLFFFQRLVLLC
jgi:CIC family chloride channel protein